MSHMTDEDIITLSVNELPVERALSLFLTGMTKVDACAEAGISTKTLQRYLRDNPQAQLNALVAKQKEIMPYYDKVIDAKKLIIEELILAANDPFTDLKVKVAILGQLNLLQKEMELAAGAGTKDTGSDKEANLEAMNYLKTLGPRLKSGKVTITQTQMTVDEN